MGTVRLTGSLPGITNPKESLHREVHAIGDDRGHTPTDSAGGHVAVKDAGVIGAQCS